MSDTKTPAAFGYRLPAEWEPHAATWLAWPHNRDTWPGKFEPIPAVWAEFVRTVSPFEPVHVLAAEGDVMREARAMVGHLPGVTLHSIPTNDAWIRDHGPVFLAGPPDRPPALVDWEYNAWGGKYPPFDLDNRVPRRIAEATGRRRFCPGIVLEGGAIDSNGQGTILAAEDCLTDANRNPGLSKDEIQRYLADYLGARRVVWIRGSIAGDDTDGHVDQLARFVGPTTVVAALERNPADENHAVLKENFEALQRTTDQEERPFEVIPLPMPRPIHFQGRRLPASYANFYIANGLVVAPQFDDPADREAAATLARLFPDRKVCGLPAVDLAWGLGAYHCATRDEPADTL
ncbi:MAG: agmatine deiminase family protein [Planctomycetota bacterium]